MTSTVVTRRRGRVASAWPQYLAISPYYLLFAVFSLFPVGFSLWLAFQRWNGTTDVQFVGLQQFAFLLKDPTFWLSLSNTLIIWVISTVPTLFFALVIAALLNSVKRFKALYQIVLFLPSVTSIVAIAIFFNAIFNSRYGVLNDALGALGLPTVQWLENPWAIKIVLAILLIWQWTGYNAIIYHAGMQAIPGELYEAATMDGANPVQAFWNVTVPALRPVILFTVVISTITGLQTFTEPQVMFGSDAALNANNGGPGQAGLTMVLYFYQQAFTNNDYGYGAAIAWAVFVVVAVFALINWRIVARSEK